MNILQILNSADMLGPGAALAPNPRNNAITMKKSVAADSSSSDLASHHLWTEPSATDVRTRDWRAKRELEKKAGRNIDPYEWQAQQELHAEKEEVTGPCGCTLKIGEKVYVEGGLRGTILKRDNRVLTVNLRDGRTMQFDQRQVFRPKLVR